MKIIPGLCPYCGFDPGDGYGPCTVEVDSVHQDVLCAVCGREWTNCYGLRAVIDDTGDVIDYDPKEPSA